MTIGEKEYKNRVILITGGGSGIGRELALTFARQGAAVAITGRRKDPLAETVHDIVKDGGKAMAITGDISNPMDCQKAVAECVSQLGHLHVLINNAGIARIGSLAQTADDEIAHMLDINLRGAMLMSKYSLPELTKQGATKASNILNIGSSAATVPVKNFSVYSAAKAGMNHFTRCMALELAPDHIRVNCINPGVVDTPIFETMMPTAAVQKAMENFAVQTPLGRVGQPSDIAEAALFLCSSKAAWITGAVLLVDGGISLG